MQQFRLCRKRLRRRKQFEPQLKLALRCKRARAPQVAPLDRLGLHFIPLLREESVLDVNLRRPDELRAVRVLVPHLDFE